MWSDAYWVCTAPHRDPLFLPFRKILVYAIVYLAHSHKLISGGAWADILHPCPSTSHPVNVYDPPGADCLWDLKDWPPCWLFTAWWWLANCFSISLYPLSLSFSLSLSHCMFLFIYLFIIISPDFPFPARA